MEVHLYINMQVYILCIDKICTNNDIFNVLGPPTELKTVDLTVAKKKSVANPEIGHTYSFVSNRCFWILLIMVQFDN